MSAAVGVWVRQEGKDKAWQEREVREGERVGRREERRKEEATEETKKVAGGDTWQVAKILCPTLLRSCVCLPRHWRQPLRYPGS